VIECPADVFALAGHIRGPKEDHKAKAQNYRADNQPDHLVFAIELFLNYLDIVF